MTIPSAIASFAVVAGLLTMIPGLDTALVLRVAVNRGRPHAFAAALGINTGALVWGVTAAVGVSALLTASQLAYTALRLAGAAYMIWLGASMLCDIWRRDNPGARGDSADRPLRSPVASTVIRSWSQGAATNLLNPKVGVFYMAMLPQFIPAHAPRLPMGLLLAFVHDLEGLAWFTLLICGAHSARRWLGSRMVHRAVDGITGAVLVGFGLKLTLSGR